MSRGLLFHLPSLTVHRSTLCPIVPFPFVLKESGWKVCEAPPKTTHRSIIYDMGVKLVSTDHGDGKPKYRWVCMCTEDCQELETRIGMSGGATTNATNHLRDRHNYVGKRSGVMAASKQELADKVCTTE